MIHYIGRYSHGYGDEEWALGTLAMLLNDSAVLEVARLHVTNFAKFRYVDNTRGVDYTGGGSGGKTTVSRTCRVRLNIHFVLSRLLSPNKHRLKHKSIREDTDEGVATVHQSVYLRSDCTALDDCTLLPFLRMLTAQLDAIIRMARPCFMLYALDRWNR